MRILEIFRDEKGNYSSNRFIGILSGLSLCTCLIISAASHREITPHDGLIDAVVFICTGSLGFGMINKVAEKIYGHEKGQSNTTENTTPTSEG
jgi:hypothetical protein